MKPPCLIMSLLCKSLDGGFTQLFFVLLAGYMKLIPQDGEDYSIMSLSEVQANR